MVPILREIWNSACGHPRPVLALRELFHDNLSALPMDCLTSMVADCSKREDFETARELEDFARDAGSALSYSLREALLKVYARAGTGDGAGSRGLELFREMVRDGLQITEGLCGALLARCAESGYLELAEAVAVHLRENSMATLATYRAAMRVYACNDQYDKACDLFEQIKTDGIEPDAVMYGCLMKFAEKCGQ